MPSREPERREYDPHQRKLRAGVPSSAFWFSVRQLWFLCRRGRTCSWMRLVVVNNKVFGDVDAGISVNKRYSTSIDDQEDAMRFCVGTQCILYILLKRTKRRRHFFIRRRLRVFCSSFEIQFKLVCLVGLLGSDLWILDEAFILNVRS